MAPPKKRLPAYRHQKSRNQAVVRLNGRDFYLGPYGSPESHAEYNRLIGEWLAAGKSVPRAASDLTVVELAAAYERWARGYSKLGDDATRSHERTVIAMKELAAGHGLVTVEKFGPLSLEAIQTRLADRKLARGYVNSLTNCIRACFKWGVSKELIPPAVYQALACVRGLRQGRSAARETAAIGPVAGDVVDATLAYLSPIVGAMVCFQRLTGCRPGEVCRICSGDVDRSGDVWVYRPAQHKTKHHGHVRAIPIGPKAQAILRPYLLRGADSPCFSPAEAEADRMATMRANRKTRVQPSQVDRKTAGKKRKFRDSYTKEAYLNAITRAVKKANAIKAVKPIPHWHPNQLRHSAATEIRSKFGLESAQVVLGHAKADTTQIYAEKNLTLAVEVARQIG